MVGVTDNQTRLFLPNRAKRKVSLAAKFDIDNLQDWGPDTLRRDVQVRSESSRQARLTNSEEDKRINELKCTNYQKQEQLKGILRRNGLEWLLIMHKSTTKSIPS